MNELNETLTPMISELLDRLVLHAENNGAALAMAVPFDTDDADGARTELVAAFGAQGVRIAELEAMLTKLQWASNRYQFDDQTITICPVCLATEFMNSRGHRDDCELAALLHKEAHGERDSW